MAFGGLDLGIYMHVQLEASVIYPARNTLASNNIHILDNTPSPVSHISSVMTLVKQVYPRVNLNPGSRSFLPSALTTEPPQSRALLSRVPAVCCI